MGKVDVRHKGGKKKASRVAVEPVSANKKVNRRVAGKDGAYLTKRILLKAVRDGFKAAAENAMAAQGYVVVGDSDFVYKLFADGSREVIKAIPRIDRPKHIILKP